MKSRYYNFLNKIQENISSLMFEIKNIKKSLSETPKTPYEEVCHDRLSGVIPLLEQRIFVFFEIRDRISKKIHLNTLTEEDEKEITFYLEQEIK